MCATCRGNKKYREQKDIEKKRQEADEKLKEAEEMVCNFHGVLDSLRALKRDKEVEILLS